MIVTRLLGGLGNQLFQYAAGRALAARHRTTLKLDIDAFGAYRLRRYAVDAFRIGAAPLGPDEKARLRIADGLPGGARGLLSRLRHGRPMPIFRERRFEYDPAWETAPSHCYLDGYWQSPRYFAAIEDVLRGELVVRDAPDEANRTAADRIRATVGVAVHVRRGDYVTSEHTNRYHGTCGPEYYAAAEAALAVHDGPLHLFVFSDDPDWAEANLRFFSPATFMRHNDPLHDYEDLRLMTQCRHHIIANSTFSWWGAWLCTHPGKTVIAPLHWFREAGHDTADLIPAEWIRL